jgi:hypothetical protein
MTESGVTTMHGRRADGRWNRMVVGDLLAKKDLMDVGGKVRKYKLRERFAHLAL